jgi:O-acetyl-ADP-ribose deacetylase (regulator of RNase III)
MPVLYTENRDILDAKEDGIVVPVNCRGVPGAGLALSWANRFPGHAEIYKAQCNQGQLKLGGPSLLIRGVHYNTATGAPAVSICFATKDNWTETSNLKSISSGLKELYAYLNACMAYPGHMKSIAMPKLGCGLGALSWADVHPLIVFWAETWEGTTVVYL